MTKKVRRLTRPTPGMRARLPLVVTVLVFGVIGAYLLQASFAAGTFQVIEPESGARSGNQSVVNESGTAGGSAIKFGATTTTGTSPVAINGQLHVCGLQLCNQYNKPIQLRGMSTHGLQWYGYGSLAEVECINDSSLDSLKNDWGADVMRVSLYVQEGGYETNPAGFTTMADTIIDKLIARGLYVLIDWHQLNPGDPNYNLSRAKTYFTHMAQRYKDVPNVLYEVANEPNSENSTVKWSTVKQYHDQMVPHIRAIDSDNIIILGTPGWDTFGDSDGDPMSNVWNNPVSGSNLMYTWHMYTASDTDTSLLDQASSRLPVFVTEWGTQQSSGDGGNNFNSSQNYINLMASKKISWTNWNYSDDNRTGAVFTSGTCPNGPWTGNRLKAAGQWIQDRMKTPDDFPTN